MNKITEHDYYSDQAHQRSTYMPLSMIPGLSHMNLHQTTKDGKVASYRTTYQYIPEAMRIVQEAYTNAHGISWDMEGEVAKCFVDTVAKHLSLQVAHKPIHFTVHARGLEDGTFEARIETIEKWCAAVVTAKTMNEVVAQAEKIGAVL